MSSSQAASGAPAEKGWHPLSQVANTRRKRNLVQAIVSVWEILESIGNLPDIHAVITKPFSLKLSRETMLHDDYRHAVQYRAQDIFHYQREAKPSYTAF